jgi:hypothetical protein
VSGIIIAEMYVAVTVIVGVTRWQVATGGHGGSYLDYPTMCFNFQIAGTIVRRLIVGG